MLMSSRVENLPCTIHITQSHILEKLQSNNKNQLKSEKNVLFIDVDLISTVDNTICMKLQDPKPNPIQQLQLTTKDIPSTLPHNNNAQWKKNQN